MPHSIQNILNQARSQFSSWTRSPSTDPDEAFREWALRVLVVIHVFIALALPVYGLMAFGSLALMIPAEMLLILGATILAIRHRKLELAGWLLLLAGYWIMLGSALHSEPWPFSMKSSHWFLVWGGALVLPARSGRWIPYLTMALFTTILLTNPSLGSDLESPDITREPLGSIAAMGVAVVVMWSGINYLLRELYRQRGALRSLINTLEDRVRARTSDLEAAVEISHRFTVDQSLPVLVQEMTDRTREIYGLLEVSVYHYDERNETLNLLTASIPEGISMPDEFWQMSIHHPTSRLARTARARESTHVTNATSPPIRPVFALPSMRSALTLPLVSKDVLIGVMVLMSERPDCFGTDETRVFTLLAQNLAVSMHNTLLYAAKAKANQRLRSLDRTKSQFMAGISHELQTPLDLTLNFTEFVMEGIYGPINERQRDALSKAYTNAQQLHGDINMLLDLSRLEAGLITLDVQPGIDLNGELADIGSTVNSLLKGKSVVFIEDIDDDLPVIAADRRRLRQIWLNLLSNAAKFTESGSITFSVKKQWNSILLAVIDTGPGIGSQDIGTIFEPFVQTQLGLRKGGTGLGLAITRALAEAHGGSITIESVEGQGTAFYVSLPICPVAQLKAARAAPAADSDLIG